jgi:hypothetical protein
MCFIDLSQWGDMCCIDLSQWGDMCCIDLLQIDVTKVSNVSYLQAFRKLYGRYNDLIHNISPWSALEIQPVEISVFQGKSLQFQHNI